jgi:flagellar biosynthesis protein
VSKDLVLRDPSMPAPPSAEPERVDLLERSPETRARLPARRRRQAAIALKHDTGQEAAPRLVAKGYGAVAEKILKLAFDNDVSVRHDPDLVEVLAAVEIDCQIPIEAFAAVAEILSYVYEANGRLTAADPDEAAP